MADTCKTCGGCTSSRHETCGRDKPNKGKCACVAAAADIDWSRWLPASDTPDTGPKDFKCGQVFAEKRGCGSSVRRITHLIGADEIDSEILAGERVHGRFLRNSWTAHHAVLVQGVGQPEPTPPDVLYGGVVPPVPPARELFPGDVITAFGYRFKLLARVAIPPGPDDKKHEWSVDPLEPEVVGNIDRMRFALADVTRVVPGWRAGQRRRVWNSDGEARDGVVIGESSVAGRFRFWLDGSATADVPSEWRSELLEEAPAPTAAAPWRAGQIRRVLNQERTPADCSLEGYIARRWSFTGAKYDDYWMLIDRDGVCQAVRESWASNLQHDAPCLDKLTVEQAKSVANLESGERYEHLRRLLAPRQAAYLRRPLDPEKVARARAAIDTLTARTMAPKPERSDAEAAMAAAVAELDAKETAATEKLFEEVYGGAFPPLPPLKGKDVRLSINGVPAKIPDGFEFNWVIGRPPLREVSSNGRDWVNYASLVDPDPFESYPQRRVDGFEVGAPIFLVCSDRRPAPDATANAIRVCAREGTRRALAGGWVVLCDEHYLDREGKLTALAKFTEANVSARIRMRLMDLDVERRRAPGRPATAYPTMFGGDLEDPMTSAKERYRNDPVFHRLVDVLRSLLAGNQATPSELREALMLAVYCEEMENPSPVFARLDLLGRDIRPSAVTVRGGSLGAGKTAAAALLAAEARAAGETVSEVTKAPKKLYVLAASQHRFALWCREQGINPLDKARVGYIANRWYLQGIEGPKRGGDCEMVIVHGASDREDFADVIETARVRGF